MKQNNGLITFITVTITYVIVNIVYKLTGFHYNVSEGIFKFKLVIDIILWGIVSFVVYVLIKMLLGKINIK